MRKLRWLFAPVTVGILALVIACGGDDNGDSDSGNSGSSGTGSSVSRELDLTNAAADLLELRSFKFDMALKMDFDLSALTDSSEEEDEFGAAFAQAFLALFSDIKMKGSYVAPDSFDMFMTIAGEEVHVIQIGDEAWTNDGSGWELSEPGSGDLGFFSTPTEALDIIPQEVLQNARTKSEKVNGIETTRYSFDREAIENAMLAAGEDISDFADVDEASLDVWMTRDNIPVKIAMTAKGAMEDGSEVAIDIAFSISDLNDNKIEIKRPI